jgi:hypothetical protein
MSKIPPPYNIFANAVNTLLSISKIKIPIKAQKKGKVNLFTIIGFSS